MRINFKNNHKDSDIFEGKPNTRYKYLRRERAIGVEG